jgi:hypothetical protein
MFVLQMKKNFSGHGYTSFSLYLAASNFITRFPVTSTPSIILNPAHEIFLRKLYLPAIMFMLIPNLCPGPG